MNPVWLPWGSLHVHAAGDLPLIVAVSLAGLGSAVVVGLGLAAFARRRSTPYLLVALALGVLAARTGVAVFTMADVVSIDLHHVVEHLLDFVMAALVLAAVYYARSVERSVDGEGETYE